jgi:hypothetical protein
MDTCKLVVALLASLSWALGDQRVFTKDGRVLLESPAGEVVTLTTSGRDFDPWITLDGKSVLFVRSDPVDSLRTSVCAIDLRSRAERLVFAGPLMYRGHEVPYLGGPEMDANEKTLYVLAKVSVSTGALFAVDLETKSTSYLAEAASYDIIRCGKQAGDLLVYQRKEDLIGAIYYVYWLYSPGGQDLGIAGLDNMDTSALIRGPCMAAQQAGREAPAAALPPGAPTWQRENQPAAISLDSQIMASKLLVHVEPEYPVQAKADQVEGIVRLLIRISSNGSVDDVKLISGHPELVQ